jgi:hypothetical protein
MKQKEPVALSKRSGSFSLLSGYAHLPAASFSLRRHMN